jgi:hypothetical protein
MTMFERNITARYLHLANKIADDASQGLQAALSPPAYAKHLARSPFIQFPSFCILKPDTFVAGDVQGQVMILEILVVASFRHVHVDCAFSQTSTNVEVHPHVCCSNLVRFGF